MVLKENIIEAIRKAAEDTINMVIEDVVEIDAISRIRIDLEESNGEIIINNKPEIWKGTCSTIEDERTQKFVYNKTLW